MRKGWVVVLSLIAFVLGLMGFFIYNGLSRSLGSLSVACTIIATAEQSKFLTKEQVKDTVERMVKRLEEDAKKKPETAAKPENLDFLKKELTGNCFGAGGAKK